MADEAADTARKSLDTFKEHEISGEDVKGGVGGKIGGNTGAHWRCDSPSAAPRWTTQKGQGAGTYYTGQEYEYNGGVADGYCAT